MTRTRMTIVDADDFVLSQVYRPFQNMIGLWDERVMKLPYSNEETLRMLKEDTEWAKCVKDRIKRCKFKYNKRIVHPVIEYLKSLN